MHFTYKKIPLFFSRPSVGIVLLIFFYFLLISPFSEYMRNKPVLEKIGQVPSVTLLKLVSVDQKQLTAASLILKVLIYFGGLLEDDQVKYKIPPDYQTMSRILHAAIALDPYNMDAYYFAQSILVWDVGQIQVANNLLEYGMKYRSWDWYLPFFAGFNYAYVLKDYKSAAKYYKLAGDLSGQSLFVNLAGRYMHEAGQTELALSYLSTMVKSAKNPSIKRIYVLRLTALEVVRTIELARDSYRRVEGRFPESVKVLLQAGYLKDIPVDPYGGKFFIATDGKVETTSKFSLPQKNHQ